MAWIIYTLRGLGALLFAGVGLLVAISGLVSGGPVVPGLVGLGLLGLGFASWPRRPEAWRHDPPTERQLRYARDLGIDVPPRISKGELSDLISQATGR